jgi:hypothetical protein
MTTIAAVTPAPPLLQLTDEHLANLSNWFSTWIGWDVHHKLAWALCGLPSSHLLSDIDAHLRGLRLRPRSELRGATNSTFDGEIYSNRANPLGTCERWST